MPRRITWRGEEDVRLGYWRRYARGKGREQADEISDSNDPDGIGCGALDEEIGAYVHDRASGTIYHPDELFGRIPRSNSDPGLPLS